MMVALLYLLMGPLAWWAAFYIYSRVRAARGWPTVPGEILERGLDKPILPLGRGPLNYPLYVKYAYSVDSKDYTNDQVSVVGREGYWRSVAQKRVDRLPNPIPVHYNPNEPSQSYLLVNSLWPVWMLIPLGALGFCLGLGN